MKKHITRLLFAALLLLALCIGASAAGTKTRGVFCTNMKNGGKPYDRSGR